MNLLNNNTINSDTIAELKRLQMVVRKLVTSTVAGQYRSFFKGHGIEFEELRNYQTGDDVRAIDWKVTARSQHPFIKIYREERELDVVIAVDVSRSTATGWREKLKRDLVAQLGASLSLIALNSNDKIGLVSFSDRIEKYFPPKKARGAVWRILHHVLLSPQEGANLGTSLEAVCSFLNRVLKKRTVVFIISDFLTDFSTDTSIGVATAEFSKALATLAKKHDVTAVFIDTTNISQSVAGELGFINVSDAETGEKYVLDYSDQDFVKTYSKLFEDNRAGLIEFLKKNKVKILELSPDLEFMPKLREYFTNV